MNFGKYYDLTVQQVIDKGQRAYLRWCYFNNSMISFSDEVLNNIGITKEHRIKKPGKDAQYHKEHDINMRVYRDNIEFIKSVMTENADKRMAEKCKLIHKNIQMNSKNLLMKRNRTKN